MIKILYVHGYLGSGNGSASRRIRAELERRGIEHELIAPQFNVTDYNEMTKTISDYAASGEFDYIAASSLGAFYTMQTKGPVKILVNPAVAENLRNIVSKEGIENNPTLTDTFLDALDVSLSTYLNNLSDNERKKTYIIYGTRDVIAPNEHIFAPYFNDSNLIYHVDMEHRLNDAGAAKVCDIIEAEELWKTNQKSSH